MGWGEGSCKEGRTKEPLAPPYRVLTLEAVVCPALLGQLSGLGGKTGVGKTESAGGGQFGEVGQTPGLAGPGCQVQREGLGAVRWLQHAYKKC